MKKKIINLFQIFINLLLIPIYFIKFIEGVGHLPTEGGGAVIKFFYHSPYENLTDSCFIWALHANFTFILLSVILSLFSLIKKDNSKLDKTSFIISILSVVIASITILLSTTVKRGY